MQRSKLPPYIPIAPLQSKDITLQEMKNEIELVKPHIKLLKASGFNIVRFLAMWKAIEPTPAVSRGFIPFLTEFGGSQDWDHLYAQKWWSLLHFLCRYRHRVNN